MNEEGISVNDVAQKLANLIEQCISPNSSNVDRATANRELNEYLKTTIFTDLIRHLKVAKKIVARINEASLGDAMFNSVKELHVHFGFNILEELVKVHWYHFFSEEQQDLKAKCVRWCQTRLFSIVSDPDKVGFYQGRLSTSPLVLNSCSRVVTEVFIREWSQEWPNFLPEITVTSSLVTLQTFFNISDMLHVQVMPRNVQRRKEILKLLAQNSDTIYNYFCRCIDVFRESNENLQEEYKWLLLIKTLETLESLLEWFCLNSAILQKLFSVVNDISLDLFKSNPNFSRVNMLAFKCIQTLLKRTNQRDEDRLLLEDHLYDFDPSKFTHYLICVKFKEFSPLFENNLMKEYPEMFELTIIVLDIAVELMTRIVTLLNMESTNAKVRSTIQNNVIGWQTFFAALFSILNYNHVCCDEILLRFLSCFIKLKQSSESHVSTLTGTIVPMFGENFLKMIVIKFAPKGEEEVSENELYLGYQIDSYDTYLSLFYSNRAKFTHILQQMTSKEPLLIRCYMEHIYRGVVESQARNNPWLQLASITQTTLGYMNPEEYTKEFIGVMEEAFKVILIQMRNGADYGEISGMLSCISSMTKLYDKFDLALLKQVLDMIFQIAIIERQWNDTSLIDLQHHVSAFFIKFVASHIQPYLLPHFDWMRSFFDSHFESKRIRGSMFCNFYDGLFILSNKMPVHEQREFLCRFLLPKISWIASYSMGDGGVNFFRDIGLSKEPNLNATKLPYNLSENEIYPQTVIVIHMMSRLFRRLSPERLFDCLWSEVDLYHSLVVPFFKIISYINCIWAKRRATFKTDLDYFCHPFYQSYVFEEIPSLYLYMINSDQRGESTVSEEKTKTLDRSGSDKLFKPESIGRQMQQRFIYIYQNSLSLINLAFANMCHFYSCYPQTRSKIEECLNLVLEPFYANLHAVPLCMHYDLFKGIFHSIANYAPRNEFLVKTGVLQVLVKFISSMFAKLNEQFEVIRSEQQKSVANSEPVMSLRTMPLGSKQFDKSCQEVIDEKLLHIIGVEFIQFLNGIFSPLKDVKRMFGTLGEMNDNESSAKEAMEMDQEFDGSLETTRSTLFSENELLSKILLDSPERFKVIEVVTGCLLWPLSARTTIASTNVKLLKSLIQRNMIDTIDEFYYVAERILRAVMLTDRDDLNSLSILTGCFLVLYEHVVLRKNLSSIIHPQLSNICNVEEKQWAKFAASLNNNNNEKKKLRSLRSLIENVSKQSLSSLHAKVTPTVFALGDPPKAISVEQPELVELSSLF